MVTSGNYGFVAEPASLIFKTGRTGMGRRAGHDLVLAVGEWSGEALVDFDNPENFSVSVEARVESIEVREGKGGVKPLSDGDKAEIRKTLLGILESAAYPTISFRSTTVAGTPQSFTVEGELTIRGTTEKAVFSGRVDGERVHATTTVTQSQWGIKPYSAFFGALRLADDVAVEVDATLEPRSV